MSKVLGIKELCEFWQAIKAYIVQSDTTTLSDFFTVDSTNATIASGALCCATRYGKVVQMTITWQNKNAITVPADGNLTNIPIGTVKAAYRPAHSTCGISHGDGGGAAWYTLQQNGTITLNALDGTGTQRTVAANKNFRFSATYILP